MNLLLHKSWQNAVGSLIDNLCLLGTFKSRCQSEPFATQVKKSLIQNYSANWLCGDNTQLLLYVQMSKWTFCHTSHNRILFALWFKTFLQTDFVGIIHNFYFIKSWMSNWTFCFTSHNRILFALLLKTILQSDFVVIIYSFYFQVQMSNWTFCHTSHNSTCLLFDSKLQTDFVVTIYVLYILSSPDVKLNLLLHKPQQNPVSSLTQNFAN